MVNFDPTDFDWPYSPLVQWVNQALGVPGLRVQVRLRGTHLHILCEGLPCPDANHIEAHFVRSLRQQGVAAIPHLDRPISHVLLYGRLLGQSLPAWTRPVVLLQGCDGERSSHSAFGHSASGHLASGHSVSGHSVSGHSVSIYPDYPEPGAVAWGASSTRPTAWAWAHPEGDRPHSTASSKAASSKASPSGPRASQISPGSFSHTPPPPAEPGGMFPQSATPVSTGKIPPPSAFTPEQGTVGHTAVSSTTVTATLVERSLARIADGATTPVMPPPMSQTQSPPAAPRLSLQPSQDIAAITPTDTATPTAGAPSILSAPVSTLAPDTAHPGVETGAVGPPGQRHSTADPPPLASSPSGLSHAIPSPSLARASSTSPPPSMSSGLSPIAPPEITPSELAPLPASGHDPEWPPSASTPANWTVLARDLARQLGEMMRAGGVSVRVTVKIVPARPAEADAFAARRSANQHRLWAMCRALEPLDWERWREPTTRLLRQLRLEGFLDGVVLGQHESRSEPDWILRVNLATPAQMLREWARWGDVQAIGRTLDQALAGRTLPVAAVLKESTLHLFCQERLQPGCLDSGRLDSGRLDSGRSPAALGQAGLMGIVTPLMQQLAPQGIHSMVVYGAIAAPELPASPPGSPQPAPHAPGQGRSARHSPIARTQPVPAAPKPAAPKPAAPELDAPEPSAPVHPAGSAQPTDLHADAPFAPQWVEWVDLPAMALPRRSESALTLAQQGDRDALAFLLTRLVNTDLDTWLATGGIRVQTCRRGDLLHLMTDGPTCPERGGVAPSLANCLRQLHIPGVSGVRIYGRAAGRKQPEWQFGEDFVVRHRHRPEPAPDFTTLDLPQIAPEERDQSGPAISILSTVVDERPWWERYRAGAVGGLRTGLVRSRLFVPAEGADLVAVGSYHPPRTHPLMTSVAAAATLGVLVVGYGDWIGGHLLRMSTASLVNDPARLAGRLGAESGDVPLSLGDHLLQDQGRALAAELTPIPEPQSFPSFNSPQLEDQLALYQAFLLREGVPDILVVGSSRSLRGINPAQLQAGLAKRGYPDVKIFNFGVNGATAQIVDLVLRGLLPPQQLPRVILWTDGVRAFNSGRVDATYQAIATSPAYRLLKTGQFPAPLLPPHLQPSRSTAATATPEAPPRNPQAASRSTLVGSPEAIAPGALISTRTVPALLRDAPAGQWIQHIPLTADIEAWLAPHYNTVSQLYPQRSHLKVHLQAQLQDLPAFGALAGETPPPSGPITPALPFMLTGARQRLSDAPVPQRDGEDGVVDTQGFLPLSIKFNPRTYYQTYARVSGEFDSDYRGFSLNGIQDQALQSILDLAQSHQIPVIFVNTPLTDIYLDPSRSQREQVFNDYMQTQPLLYLDFARVWVNRYERFSDPSHLNRYGAEALTAALVEHPAIPWDQFLAPPQDPASQP